MQVYLATYIDERVAQATLVAVDDNYDGDPYGDHVPFAVGSNQTIVTEDNPRWEQCAKLSCAAPGSAWVLMELGDDYHGKRTLAYDTSDESVRQAAARLNKEQVPCHCGHTYHYTCREVPHLSSVDILKLVGWP